MLSKEEWNKTAERAAAAEYGAKHARWLRFKRFGAVPLSALVTAGALGLGAWWTFSHLLAPLFAGAGPDLSGHLPLGFLLVVLAAGVGTVAAFRVSVPSASFLIARAVLSVLVWLGLLAFAIGSLA